MTVPAASILRGETCDISGYIPHTNFVFVARSPGEQESLDLFGKMRQGRLEEGSATLRLKMDMTSPNPNMWDQVG